jgi:hypothetical protein
MEHKKMMPVSIRKVIFFLLLTGAFSDFCVGQPERVCQVLEFEFAYSSETLNWNRIDALFHEHDVSDVSRRMRKDDKEKMALTQDERLLARKCIIFLQEVIQTIPEYSSLKFECHRSVKVDQRTEVLQWSVSRSDAGGVPYLVELVFVDKELINPKIRIIKNTNVMSKNGSNVSFRLAVDLTDVKNGSDGKIIFPREAVVAALGEVKLHPILKDELDPRLVTVRSCSNNHSLFWIVWIASNGDSVMHTTVGPTPWLSDALATNFTSDDGEHLKVFPVLVLESGQVSLGVESTDDGAIHPP